LKSRSALPVRKWFPQPRSNNLLHTFPLAGDLAEGLDGSSTHGTSDPIYNPVEIHLQYLPDVVPLARAWNHTGLSDGGEPQAGSTRALARTSAHRPRITGSRPRSKSRSCKTKIANIRKDFVPSRRTTLPKTTPLCSSRTCASGICRSQGEVAKKTRARSSSRSQA